jgi:hypothetical protein
MPIRLRIPLFAFACLSLLEAIAHTQDRRVLEQRYGSPVSGTYRTSTNVLIKPSFASNGGLCSTTVEAEGKTMKDAELDLVLDELAPKATRGKYLMGTFLNLECVETDKLGKLTGVRNCGGVSEDYKHVTITKWGNTNDYASAEIVYYRRGCKTKKHPWR